MYFETSFLFIKYQNYWLLYYKNLQVKVLTYVINWYYHINNLLNKFMYLFFLVTRFTKICKWQFRGGSRGIGQKWALTFFFFLFFYIWWILKYSNSFLQLQPHFIIKLIFFSYPLSNTHYSLYISIHQFIIYKKKGRERERERGLYKTVKH